jgi:hypothetical protein
MNARETLVIYLFIHSSFIEIQITTIELLFEKKERKIQTIF